MFQWSLFVSSLLVLAVATPTRRDWPSVAIVCAPNDTHTPDAVKEAVLVGASRTLPVIGGGESNASTMSIYQSDCDAQNWITLGSSITLIICPCGA